MEVIRTGCTITKKYKANMAIFKVLCSIPSPNSLYNQEVVTFEEDSVYDQTDAQGFIRLTSLRLRLNAAVRKARS